VIAARVDAVRERIARAASRAGRRSEEVTLVAVSKTHPAERVRDAFAAGVRDFGENRLQEAEPKIGALHDLREQGLRWHLVGHLQSNKARKAAVLFDRIHSLDEAGLARRLDAAAAEAGRRLSVLVQVDLAGEETKFGLEEARLMPALEERGPLTAVRLEGLMALPPYEADPERVRPYFRRLRELRDRARQAGLLSGSELSMGMSHDLEVAVEEGATLVRVGTAIFGERAAPLGGAD
jgi:pyridoxal phosphate enzyme (YggS family)